MGFKKAKIEIYKCADKYCGKIVWLRDPYYKDGTEKRDTNNPNESLQNRPAMGMNILTDFEYDEDLEWEGGKIYDPEEGKTYCCVINMDKDNNKILKVRGYVGFPLIGRTGFWDRSVLD